MFVIRLPLPGQDRHLRSFARPLGDNRPVFYTAKAVAMMRISCYLSWLFGFLGRLKAIAVPIFAIILKPLFSRIGTASLPFPV